MAAILHNYLILSYLASGLYVAAKAQHDLNACDGDSLSNSTLSLRSHSTQSSRDTLLVTAQAWRGRKKGTD